MVDGVAVIVPPQQVIDTVDTVSDLRALNSENRLNGDLVIVRSTKVQYVWDSTSVAVDDGASIIRPDDRTPLQAGRYVSENTAFGNVAKTLDDLKAAPTTNVTMLYDGATFNWTLGNFTGQADDVNIVKADSTDLSFGAWVRQSANSVTFRQDSTNTITETTEGVLRNFKLLTSWGVSPDASPAQNLARIKNAISDVQPGTLLILPQADQSYEVDTSGGLSGAIEVNKRIDFEIHGDIEATATVIGANASTIFRFVSGSEGSTFTGRGVIRGDGSVNDENSGNDDTIPSLVRVEADNVTISGLTFAAAPKVGLHLYGGDNCKVLGCTFTGGPTEYSDTGYFHLRLRFANRTIIHGCHFVPDEDGGMAVQCVFANNANNCIVSDCISYRPFEKLIYWFGSGNLFKGLVTVGNTGVIPGTNIEGTITTVYRANGSFNTFDGCYAVSVAGGATCMDGPGNQIVNCMFLNCGAGGVAIFGGTTSFEFTKVANTTCTYAPLKGFLASDGIAITAPNGISVMLSCRGNAVTGFSRADPLSTVDAWTPNTAFPRYSIIKPTVGNGRYYVPQSAGGTTGSTEPTWPTTPGATVVDGTITWVAVPFAGGQAEIKITGAGAGIEITESIINDNIINGMRGISLSYVTNSTVANNRVQATDWGLIEGAGTCDAIAWLDNSVRGTVNTTVQNISNTSLRASGLPFPWAPNQGSGLVVDGDYSSEGWCVEDAETITVWGWQAGSVSIANAGGGELCSNLPVEAAFPAAGTVYNSDLAGPGGCAIYPYTMDDGKPAAAGPSKLFGHATGTRTTINWTITYRKAA